jgi:benzoylformate decarboxylase
VNVRDAFYEVLRTQGITAKAAKTDGTVIIYEWTSADADWDRFDLTRPGSLYFPASGGLGWGLPAAIGL